MTAVPSTQDPTTPAAPANQHLRAAVEIAHQARVRLIDAKAIWELAEATFRANNSAQLLELNAAKLAAENAEAQLRELAETHYKVTKDKHPVPGVDIKLVTEVELTDPAAAFAFAKTAGVCVVLDEKAYKGLAKSSANPLPGTKVDEVPKASIAKDLAAAIREDVR